MSVLDMWIEKKLDISLADRTELETRQLEQIHSLLQYAVKNSPLFRQKYEGLSLPETLKAFSSWPVTDATELQDHGLQMLCVSQSQISRVVTLHTSGTSGKPKRLFFTEEDQELTVDFFHNGMKELTKPGDTVMIFLPCTPKGSVGDLLCTGLQRLGAHPIRYGLITDLEDCAQTLIKYQAACAVGVPVQLLALGAFMQKNHLPVPLKNLLLSTDYLSPAVRQRIEDTLSCQVFNHFGMTETGLGGALECPAHEGMHIRENDLYLEILDPETLSLLPDGRWGELTLTTLTRKGMPLIRYRTGDRARLLPGSCSCGSVLKRLEYDSRMIHENPETRTFPSMAQMDDIIFSDNEVLDYTVRYYEAENLLVLNLLKFAVCSQTAHKEKHRELRRKTALKSFFSFADMPEIKIQETFIKNKIPPYGGKRKPEFYNNKGDAGK